MKHALTLVAAEASFRLLVGLVEIRRIKEDCVIGGQGDGATAPSRAPSGGCSMQPEEFRRKLEVFDQ